MIADDAIDGEYVTVASTTVSPLWMSRITFAEPAPPTRKNSSRSALAMAAITPMPWSSSWFQIASIFGAACSRFDVTSSPDSEVNSADTWLLTSRPWVARASLKPRLRSWVSDSAAMPWISAMTGEAASASRLPM
jgi:hypothetical protein